MSFMKLWKHQEQTITECGSIGALAFEPGLGKTLTAVHLLKNAYETEGRVVPTLILTPIVVINDWISTLRSVLGRYTIASIHGESVKKRLEIIQNTDILVLNYEAILNQLVYFALVKKNFMAIICDESQMVKTPSAMRTKKTTYLSRSAKYRYILSGTMANDPMDIFAQFRIIDQSLFGTNFNVFLSRFFYDKNSWMATRGMTHFPSWEIRPDKIEEFNSIINKVTFFAKKSNCLDLPPLVESVIPFDLDEDSKKIYDKMKKDLVVLINDKTISVDLAASKYIKLLQISSGFLKNENEIVSFSKKRIHVLKGLIESIPKTAKIIIWALFKYNMIEIEELLNNMGVKYVSIHGSVGQKDKEVNRELFKNDPSMRVLVGHTASCGVGANFTCSNYTIYYNMNKSLEQYLQSKDRNYRGGSEIHESITQYYIQAKGTIEEQILEHLRNKKEIGLKVMREIILK